ncbi:hypothetical protein MSAN_02359400 [Mycena sanguinolenta]|uniref:Uncharacterized protein n=1 Tax=Mycena sanguinolenta TaxID=230812 RepID=A0A8H6X6I6_9AGAR|nr:hypothetical protein MSAN_02359400 [Mycena sanguinolenta]
MNGENALLRTLHYWWDIFHSKSDLLLTITADRSDGSMLGICESDLGCYRFWRILISVAFSHRSPRALVQFEFDGVLRFIKDNQLDDHLLQHLLLSKLFAHMSITPPLHLLNK